MIESKNTDERNGELFFLDENFDSNYFGFEGANDILKKDKGVEWKEDYDGKKVFDYTDKNGGKWEIVIGKQNDNQYNFRIKKRENIEKTGEMNRKTYLYKGYVNAKDLLEFNRELGAALDETIGTVSDGKRINLANTGKKAFEDLNKAPEKTQKQPNAKIEWKKFYGGKKVFDYIDDKGRWEIEIRKQDNNQYEFTVKHLEKMEGYDEMVWATQCHKGYVNAKNLFEFNRELGAILDETIGTVDEGKRINLANVGKKVFEDLNK